MVMNGTIIIKRPPDVVEAYVNDLSNDVHWRTGVTESRWHSDEPFAVGSIGYTYVGDKVAEWRVVSYVEGESVDWELYSGPILGAGGYRFVPVEDGTEFTLVADVVPTGMYKLLGPVFGWVGRRQNQHDVEKLRDILEAISD